MAAIHRLLDPIAERVTKVVVTITRSTCRRPGRRHARRSGTRGDGGVRALRRRPAPGRHFHTAIGDSSSRHEIAATRARRQGRPATSTRRRGEEKLVQRAALTSDEIIGRASGLAARAKAFAIAAANASFATARAGSSAEIATTGLQPAFSWSAAAAT